MKAKKSMQESILVKWKQNLIIEGKLKKVFVSKIGNLMGVIESNKDRKDYIIPIPVVLKNKLKRAKNFITEESNVYIECVGLRNKGKRKYWDFVVLVDGNEIENDKGFDLL